MLQFPAPNLNFLTSAGLHSGFVAMGVGVGDLKLILEFNYLGSLSPKPVILEKNPSSNKLHVPSDPPDGFCQAFPSLGRTAVPQDAGSKCCMLASSQSPASSLSVASMGRLSCPPTCQIKSPPSASVQLQAPPPNPATIHQGQREQRHREWGRDSTHVP